MSVSGVWRERAGAVCRDIAQIDEETNIGNNTQAQGENRERHRSWASQSEQSSFLSHLNEQIYISFLSYIQENGIKPKETEDAFYIIIRSHTK